MRWLPFAFSVLILGVNVAHAQQPGTRDVTIEHADSLVARVVDGERIQSLIGNVRVRQDETHLRARRATRFLDRGEILLTGSVEITERGDSLRADTVFYNTRSKVGRARGNVWLTDGEVVVIAPSGNYDTNRKHAVFAQGVTLIDSTTTLRSLTGQYWSDERRADFAGDVRLDEDRSVLRADSITYHRDDEISFARGNVDVLHFEEDADGPGATRTHLYGATAFNDNRAGLSRMSGNPLLVQIRNDSLGSPADTLLMRALELESLRSDTLDRLIGTREVRVWQERLAAVGDSLVYERRPGEVEEDDNEEARFYGLPIAWMDDMQVSGDTLRVTSRGGAIDTLLVRSNSFVAQYDSALAEINQIKGRNLTALFIDDTLRTMRTGPQAHAIYLLKTDEDALRGGVRATGDEIVFVFEEGELHRVTISSGTEGEYFPADLLPEPFQLDGFNWQPERRPEKDVLLDDVHLEQDSRLLSPVVHLDDVSPLSRTP